MANKFEKKGWVDRQSQYPSRRKIIRTNIENVYEIERAEGDVVESGNAFDAMNMNDLEDRVYSAFSNLDSTDIKVIDSKNVFTKTMLEDVLLELFTFASNGKSLIASAVGGNASETFKSLVDKIVAGKKMIAATIGETKSGVLTGNETFSYIADFIKKNKCSFSEDGESYIAGQDLPANNTLFEYRIDHDFGFVPNRISVNGILISFGNAGSFYANPVVGKDFSEDFASGNYDVGIKDLNKSGFTFWYKNGSSSTNMSLKSSTINFTAYRLPV